MQKLHELFLISEFPSGGLREIIVVDALEKCRSVMVRCIHPYPLLKILGNHRFP
jgi:hypothetical protein